MIHSDELRAVANSHLDVNGSGSLESDYTLSIILERNGLIKSCGRMIE